MFEHCGKIIYTKYWGILAVCWKLGKFIYTNTEEYFLLNTGNIYLHKILRNTLCWALWEDLFTQNTEEYCMLSTVGRFIYTKYLGLLLVGHCWYIYLYKILGNTLCWPMWEYLFTQNTEEYFCWALSEDLFTQNTWDYFLLNTGNIYLHKIPGNTLCWALSEYLFTQNTGDYSMLNCGKIYLHKILGNTLCWVLWEYLFTQNTEEYFMLNIVGRFIYIKYWGILYVEHCEIYILKILRNTVCCALWEDLFTQNTEEYTVCWTLWEDLFTQNTEEYCMLNTGKIYLHKILRNTVRWTLRFIYTKYIVLQNTVWWPLWQDLFTQNTEEYFMLNTVRRFIYTKYWGIVNADHCGKIYLHKILRNTVCWTLGRSIYTKYWGILYV